LRYIGNKTKLLGFIRRVLRVRGIQGGVAVDPFSGTASVARELKRLGFAVIAADIMEYGRVLAKAHVETVEPLPHLRALVREMNRLPGEPGYITANFSAPLIGDAGDARMYFTTENAARIDAIRTALHERRAHGTLDDATYYVLLAALIEGSDRVANTTGVYAAFVKSWQPNARRTFEMKTRKIVSGNGCHAYRADALALVRDMEPFDLLYLDPPYNARQYAGYYHIPEMLALGWFEGEPMLRGKTGLLPDRDKRTDWSRSRKSEAALEALLASAQCKHIVMSYNAEGLIPEASIERLMKQYGRRDTYHRYKKSYRRYRSDHDRENRSYAGDVVSEYLYCVDR
jgi:adenine-specific DNA-methyltransferase